MQTYFVNFLTSRLTTFSVLLGSMNLQAKNVDSEGGFTIVEIECTSEQATKIWDAGYNVSEQ